MSAVVVHDTRSSTLADNALAIFSFSFSLSLSHVALVAAAHFTGVAKVAALSAVRMHVAKDLRSQEARRAAMRALAEIVANRFAGEPPLLDPQVGSPSLCNRRCRHAPYRQVKWPV